MTLHQKYIRFFRYTLVGGSTFLLDLGLLFLFIDTFHWIPTLAAGISFLIAVSINYAISRAWVFQGTEKPQVSVATGFLLVSLMGLGIVSGGMYVFTSLLDIHYLLARILIAGFTGMWSYLINLYYNFNVVGKKF